MNPSLQQSSNPWLLIENCWKNKNLIWQLVKREVVGRYKGSLIGTTWSFLNPLLMLGVYTFVFSVVFKARWGVAENESRLSFAIILFSGLIVHEFFAECLSRSPTLLLSNSNYVKKVIFPLEILPLIVIGSALFQSAINLIVLIFAMLIFQLDIHITIFFIPLVMLPLIIITTGLAWFISSTGIFLRDINQIIGIITTILLFVSPIFFPISAVPQPLQFLIFLNPLTFIIEQLRAVVIWGDFPNWRGLSIYGLISFLISWFGLWWFQRMRRGFADVV
ncbi:ABC transporter permease [Candidatus Pacearchaeota archaeon]|nr:ABC transporter permease [Candidatus Pacearchaeota archaeon]